MNYIAHIMNNCVFVIIRIHVCISGDNDVLCLVWQQQVYSLPVLKSWLKMSNNGGKCHHLELNDKQRIM